MKLQLSLIPIASVAWVLSANAAQSATLSFTPASQNVLLGESVEVAVTISDLAEGSAPSLGAFDFIVNYDDSILAFESAALGDPELGDLVDQSGLGAVFALAQIETVGPGALRALAVSFDPESVLHASQPDSFTLATLNFEAIAIGTSSLTFSDIITLGDASGLPLTEGLESGSVSVSIPEPTSVLGWALSMVAMGLTRSRARSTR